MPNKLSALYAIIVVLGLNINFVTFIQSARTCTLYLFALRHPIVSQCMTAPSSADNDGVLGRRTRVKFTVI